MYADNELIFPNYVIPMLRDLRGDDWRDLIDRIESVSDAHPEKMAFVLFMVRLDGCMECETDSYRAMRGCAMCVTQVLRRYKGSDDDLLKAYHQALNDVNERLEGRGDGKVAWRIA